MGLVEKLEYLDRTIDFYNYWSEEDQQLFLHYVIYAGCGGVGDVWTQEEKEQSFLNLHFVEYPNQVPPRFMIAWRLGLANFRGIEIYHGEVILSQRLTGNLALDTKLRNDEWWRNYYSYLESYKETAHYFGDSEERAKRMFEEWMHQKLDRKLWYLHREMDRASFDDSTKQEHPFSVGGLLPEGFILLTILTFLSVNVFFCNFYVSVGKPLGYQAGILVFFSLFFILLLLFEADFYQLSSFSESVSKDFVGYYVNFIVLIGSLCVCIFWLVYTLDHESIDFEFFLLILIVVLGSFVITNSNDFLSLYIGIELQSLCLYVMAGSKIRSTFSTEAGVKYFVLGGLASSLFLFGVSLTYGFVGTINFDDLQLILLSGINEKLQKSGLYIGFFFLFCGLIFKVGGAPFYMWVPDVYEGSPLSVTGFFAIVPKLAIFCVLVKVGLMNVLQFIPEVADLFLYSGILSIFVGSLGALMQTTVKRLLSYSAISHSGFILYAISTQMVEGMVSALFYLIVYVLVLCNVFAVLVAASLRYNNSSIKLISNLRYVFRSHPILGYSLMFSIFSIAGIPPLSGFFSKFFVFFSAIKGGFYFSSGLCILLSVVGSVYYLKLVRSLMFIRDTSQWVFFGPIRRKVAYLIVYSGIFNVLFCFFGFDLVNFIYSEVVASLFI